MHCPSQSSHKYLKRNVYHQKGFTVLGCAFHFASFFQQFFPTWSLLGLSQTLSVFLQLTRGPRPIGKTLPLYPPRVLLCIPAAFRRSHEEREPPSAHSTCCLPQKSNSLVQDQGAEEVYVEVDRLSMYSGKPDPETSSWQDYLFYFFAFQDLPISSFALEQASFYAKVMTSQSCSVVRLFLAWSQFSSSWSAKTPCTHRTSAKFRLLEASVDPSTIHGFDLGPTRVRLLFASLPRTFFSSILI